MDRVHTNGVPVILAMKSAALRDGEIILEVHPKGHRDRYSFFISVSIKVPT